MSNRSNSIGKKHYIPGCSLAIPNESRYMLKKSNRATSHYIDTRLPYKGSRIAVIYFHLATLNLIIVMLLDLLLMEDMRAYMGDLHGTTSIAIPLACRHCDSKGIEVQDCCLVPFAFSPS